MMSFVILRPRMRPKDQLRILLILRPDFSGTQNDKEFGGTL